MFFLIAALIAALSGMGVGGGGLFALYLKFVSEYSQLEIQGINLMFFIFAAGASLLIHLTRRRIFLIPVIIMILAGILGSLLGASIATSIDGGILGKLFGGMMIAAGGWRLIKSR